MRENMREIAPTVEELEQQAYGFGYGTGESSTTTEREGAAEYVSALRPRIRSIARDMVEGSDPSKLDAITDIIGKIVVSAYHYGAADGASGKEFRHSLSSD